MKTVKLELSYGSAYVIKQLCEYAIIQSEESMKKDEFKDNMYIIRACREYLNKVEKGEQ